MRGEITEKDVLELLENRVINLRSELRRAEEAVIALKGKSTIGNIKSNIEKARPELPLDYDINYKWDKKILFVLSKAGTAYKQDIVNEISKLEPGADPEKLANLIAVKLSSLLKEGTIDAKREGRRFRYRLVD